MLDLRRRARRALPVTAAEAAAAAAGLHAAGTAVSLERRASPTARVGAAGTTVEEVRTLLAALGHQAAPRSPDVVLLLPALATPLATDVLPAGHVRSDAVVLDRAQQVCRAARNAGVGVTVDTDDRLPVDRALGILRDLRKDFPETGVVVRAGLHRAEADCRGLAHEASRVRLVRGGLPHRTAVLGAGSDRGRARPADRTHAAYRSRLEADRSFVRCLRVLMGGQGTPEVEAGDDVLLRITRALAGRHARAAGSYELLLPSGDAARRAVLVDGGECVRALVRWGRREPGPAAPETVADSVTRVVDRAVGRVRVRALDLRDRAVAELSLHRAGAPATPWPPTRRS